MYLCLSSYLTEKATSAEYAIYGTLHGDIIVQAIMPNTRPLVVWQSGATLRSKANTQWKRGKLWLMAKPFELHEQARCLPHCQSHTCSFAVLATHGLTLLDIFCREKVQQLVQQGLAEQFKLMGDSLGQAAVGAITLEAAAAAHDVAPSMLDADVSDDEDADDDRAQLTPESGRVSLLTNFSKSAVIWFVVFLRFVWDPNGDIGSSSSDFP